jgi:hypothetical protein
MYTPVYKPHKALQAIVPFLVLSQAFPSMTVLVSRFLSTGKEGRKMPGRAGDDGYNNGRLSDVLDEVLPLL